jgi:hypothetical protein
MSQSENFVAKMNHILTHFFFYSCSILISILVLGNILNILICLRKSLIKEMIGFYNIIISVFNVFTLVLGSLIVFPIALNYDDLLVTSNFACITIMYCSRVSVLMSSWLHVFLSLDRYLCVAYNERFKFLLNDKKKLSFILMGLFGVVLVISMPNLFFRITSVTSYDPKTNQTQVNVLCTAASSIIVLRNAAVIVFRIVLPLILQIVISILLIHKLFKSRKAVAAANMSRNMKKEHRFARIIVWLNVCFIITKTPFMLTTLYFGILGVKTEYPINETASNSLALYTLIFYVTSVLGSYMFGSLFFINLFTNRIFKKEIRLFFACGPIATQNSSSYLLNINRNQSSKTDR